MSRTPVDRTAAARAEHERRAAARALDDPRQIARAERIVAAGIARGVIDIADFVEGVRTVRRAAGKPDHICDPVVYGVLDGLLAERAEAGATS